MPVKIRNRISPPPCIEITVPHSNKTPAMPRSFVALDIDAAQKAVIQQHLHRLQHHYPPARWIPASNLHITLAFLAQQPLEQLEQLYQTLSDELYRWPTFTLTIHKLAGFPNANSHIMALLLTHSHSLNTLHDRVHKCCQHLQINTDSKPFHAHITAARIKRRQSLTCIPMSLTLTISSLSIQQSLQQANAVEYQALHSICFSQA